MAPSSVEESEGYHVVLSESMKFIGFISEITTPQQVAGRFTVSKASCQPFNVLHGGVSALIAEALASAGAFLASGNQRVAGVELKINHLKAAPIGTEIFASAEPVHIGRTLHVWDVTFFKVSKKSAKEMMGPNDTKIAVSRVTLMVGIDRRPSHEDQKTTMPLARL